MKLYGVPQSPFVRKVLVVLEEKGLPYEVASPVPGQHPLGKMPVLGDGDRLIPDSSVICAYLEKRHPAPPLYPEDPGDFARALFIEEYADTQMADGMGAIVFESLIKPHMLKQPTDEKRLAEMLGAARTRWTGKPTSATGQPLPAVLDWLESQLPSGRDTVLARFSIADVALGAHLGWLEPAQLTLDPARWPRAAHYRDALLARPSFKTALGA